MGNFGKFLSKVCENLLPILVVALALLEGWNHIMFFFLFLLGVAEVLPCTNLILCSNPLGDRALLYKSLELLKMLVLLDSLRILLLYFLGGFLISLVRVDIQIQCYI